MVELSPRWWVTVTDRKARSSADLARSIELDGTSCEPCKQGVESMMASCVRLTAAAWAAMAWIVPAMAQVTIPTLRIGSPCNPADPARPYGSVDYLYNIGQHEVTNAEYAAFLNAKAASDPNSLYHTGMASGSGGITRTGTSGSYTYATVSGRENNPVNYVSFWDACRFVNWLHNGQGNGDTETGAYTLTSDGISNNSVLRNEGWQWAVTSEDEWYKAAYYQAATAGGDLDDYWLYPTSTNTINTAQANYNGSVGNTTPAGSYAPNYEDALDMGGNLWEWNEAILEAARVLRGGAFNSSSSNLAASFRHSSFAANASSIVGFRVTQYPGRCPADYNGNPCPGDVLDFLDFVDDFGLCEQQAAPCGQFGDADINGDTFVDVLDFLDFFDAFGLGCE
jgi:sulfatase modifying factor 1